MAKLGSYYGLCPLIDQRNLLGIAEDLEAGHVIVTLGKNIAIKYRLSDQKQIHSWRTKDKFSSPVIYDKETNQYMAVFNQVYVRIWTGDEEYLDKLKKYKFNESIHTLLTCNNKSFIIFKNGAIVPINFAIENRKNLNVEESVEHNNDYSLEVLSASLKDDIYIGVLLKSKEKTFFSWKIFSEAKEMAHKIELSRENDGLTLNGQILAQIEYQRNINLLTLWSDGKLYSYSLDVHGDEGVPNRVKVPGNVFAIVESLSCQHPVTMAYLNNHYIAMYGADSNEEGASLILYNTQFKVSQSKQPLKLFTSGAKLWQLENNLLVCIGQNLAVMPFHLDTEQLAALVGSHRTALNDLDPDIAIVEELEVVNWDSVVSTDSTNKSIPNKIKGKVLELSKQGLSERTICEQLLPEYIEARNVYVVSSCLNYFQDIPELYLAKLLHFCLTIETKYFKNTQPLTSDALPASLQPLERCMLLDKILIISFSDILLLPHVRAELDLNSTLLLLQYISYLMSENGHSLPSRDITESENKLIEWGCLLLDANYQKFLLTRDSKVAEILTNYNKLVEEHLSCLENMRQIVPMLTEIKKGKGINRNKQVADLKYSIEQLSLY